MCHINHTSNMDIRTLRCVFLPKLYIIIYIQPVKTSHCHLQAHKLVTLVGNIPNARLLLRTTSVPGWYVGNCTHGDCSETSPPVYEKPYIVMYVAPSNGIQFQLQFWKVSHTNLGSCSISERFLGLPRVTSLTTFHSWAYHRSSLPTKKSRTLHQKNTTKTRIYWKNNEFLYALLY